MSISDAATAGIKRVGNTQLSQFGFTDGSRLRSKSDFITFYNQSKSVLGEGVIVRTGLGWDPLQQEVPGFINWNNNVLEPALARGVTVLPSVRTLDLRTSEPFRYPTIAQWQHGLREIVRMYGPNGVYQKGGTFVLKGKTKRVSAHPGFKGLTDFELWNEPNSKGDLGGAMTPAMMATLLRTGSAVMRDQASKQGFEINIIGPAIGGVDAAYLEKLWQADRNLFSYIDTLSIHNYMRVPPSKCSATASNRTQCAKSFQVVRDFMDSHGGSNVRIGTTEGGFAGSRDTCRPPNVLTEIQQRDYSTETLKWIRARPALKFDFWLSSFAQDDNVSYRYSCGSKKYDPPYWIGHLGAIRADGSLKPWGVRWRSLANDWR